MKKGLISHANWNRRCLSCRPEPTAPRRHLEVGNTSCAAQKRISQLQIASTRWNRGCIIVQDPSAAYFAVRVTKKFALNWHIAYSIRKTQNMKNLLKYLLLPALCALFLLQAQQVAAQSKDNDVLLLKFGLQAGGGKTYGMYIFWPDKDVEFIPMELTSSPATYIANKSLVTKKINELADLGWELEIVDSASQITFYYFKRATPK